jgi:choline dehydrogenase-like flavoprotein
MEKSMQSRERSETPALREENPTERFDVIVIGGGQAGLSVGYHLARHGLTFVILDAEARTGDSWRKRWDSLRLFTPAVFDGLDGMPFPAAPYSFPTKDEMADYLESYAKRFALPVRYRVRVDRLTREGNTYVVAAGNRRFEGSHVVVAMATFQDPRVPAFAASSTPGSSRSIRANTAPRNSSGRGEFSSWAPATRARRSRSRPRGPIAPGCREETPGTFRSASTGRRGHSFSPGSSCGASFTGC